MTKPNHQKIFSYLTALLFVFVVCGLFYGIFTKPCVPTTTSTTKSTTDKICLVRGCVTDFLQDSIGVSKENIVDYRCEINSLEQQDVFCEKVYYVTTDKTSFFWTFIVKVYHDSIPCIIDTKNSQSELLWQTENI